MSTPTRRPTRIPRDGTGKEPVNRADVFCLGVDHGTAACGVAVWGGFPSELRWSAQVTLKPTTAGLESLGLRLAHLTSVVLRGLHTVDALCESALPARRRLLVAVEKPIGYTGRRPASHRPRTGLAAGVDALIAQAQAAQGSGQGRGTGVVGIGYGVVLMQCAQVGLDVIAVAPATAKAALLPGQGNRAGKPDMVRAATLLRGGKTTGPDEADAIALAMSGYNTLLLQLLEKGVLR